MSLDLGAGSNGNNGYPGVEFRNGPAGVATGCGCNDSLSSQVSGYDAGGLTNGMGGIGPALGAGLETLVIVHVFFCPNGNPVHSGYSQDGVLA